MITSLAMFRTRLAGLDPFLLAVALFCLLATGFAVSPSSYAIVLRDFGAADDGIFFGQPQPIRSDEYALWTPMLQTAVAGGLGQSNESSIYRESLRTLYALPLRDWGLLLKPTFWLFLVAPPANAYAGYFAAYTFLFLAGYYLLGRQFGSSPVAAALVALLLYFSAYTQTWWTSLGHHLAIFPWVLLLFLARLGPLARAAAVAFTTAAWFLAGTFYPPLIWTLFLTGLLGLWVFRPEFLQLAAAQRSRQLATLLGLGIGCLLAYAYLREPLAAALASSGHGERNEAGGHVPWQDFLGLFFPLFSYRGSIIISGTNHCEASAAGSVLWPLLLSFLDYGATWRELGTRRPGPSWRPRAAALVAAFVGQSAWMLLPLPAWLGLPFLWNKFPNSRLLFSVGLLSLWLALLILPYARFRAGFGRIAAFSALIVAAWWPSRIPATFEWLLAGMWRDVLRLEWRDHANSDLLPILLVGGVALLAFFLRRQIAPSRWLGGTTALALPALANLLFFGDWNPFMSARPIFARPETAVTAQLRQLQEAHPQGWLVIGDWRFLGRTLNGWGFRAVNHGFIVPETRFLRQRFPQLEAAEFHRLFERYCLLQVGLFRPPELRERLREPYFSGGDLTLVPAEAFLPETRLALRTGPPAEILPERGELRAAELDGRRLRLSFFGEINGTSGTTEVLVHLDRPGKIVDHWLRPRGDNFALTDGLRLFSRLDLEIELEAPPAALPELGICIETRDPSFGNFAIAPKKGARSLCSR